MGSEFFVPERTLTVADIAQLTGAELADGSTAEIVITGLATAGEARPGSLAFIDGKRNARLMDGLKASAVLCPPDLAAAVPSSVAALLHRNPLQAFARVGREMFPEAAFPIGATGERGISPDAVIDPGAMLEDGVVVEAGAIVGADVMIGAGTVIAANAVLGPHCRIGRNCYIGSNATVRYALVGDRVIIHPGAGVGRDGFGFAFGERGAERVPQLGRVVIQDDVEIGANSTVDRGALTDTVIGEGTKIDNLVQIAHNVKIGRSCMIAGHCGIAGSVTIGDQTMLGGRVGIADHVTIGSRVQLAASSGVMDDVPDGARWGGVPAVPVRDWFRQISFLRETSSRKKDKPDG